MPNAITFIGAGNVATHLARAFTEAGSCVSVVYSRTLASATAVAEAVGAKAVTQLDDVPATPIYIYCLKDDVLPAIAEVLATKFPESLHIHTSGSTGLDVFPTAAQRCGVVYPLQTFSKRRPLDMKRVPCFVEGRTAESLKEVRALAETISDDVTELSSDARRAMHLAAVFACNFTNHCYALAADVLQEAGVPFEKLLPLIDETAAKVHSLTPREAQTGPAVRYDRRIIDRHLAMLASTPLRHDIYQKLSESIHGHTVAFCG